jgi:uncharacterized protein (DUF2461 family)
VAPDAFKAIADYERTFKVTIHRSETVMQRAQKGVPYVTNTYWVEIANSKVLSISVRMTEWVMPLGAHGESCGPT